jgi:hypothetical protein
MTPDGRAAAEIRRLHLGFERWFNGDDTFDFEEIAAALSEDFTMFPPDGSAIAREALLDGLRSAFDTRPVRIRIDHPVILWERRGATLAAYEEWQESDDHVTARRSTVLFTDHRDAPGGLLWRHVHETWIRAPRSS